MKKIEFVSLIDFISPKRALIRGKKIQKFLNKLFLRSDFSQVKTPLKIVATDLRKGCEVNLAKGNIAEAVLASGTFPGIFPPINIGKKLLVDGGVVNSTPVDVVKKMGAEIILGVDLTMKGKVNINNPSIIEVFMRSLDVLRTKTAKLSAGKIGKNLVIIKPKINAESNFLGCFNSRKEVIKDGERAARKALPRIRKLLV